MLDHDKNLDVPPVSNRGVHHTTELPIISLVDWVAVTFNKFKNDFFRDHETDLKIEHIWGRKELGTREELERKQVDYVIRLMGLDPAEFKDMPIGKSRYKKQVARGHISVLYMGIQPDMGIHVIFTGQGCREYELGHSSTPWKDLFLKVIEENGHLTRLDLAIDDYKGYFKINQLEKRLDEGLTSSKFKDARVMKKVKISTGENKGKTVYFGSPSSDIQIRIYDKLKERQEAGKEVEEDVKHWVRTEVQLNDLRAHMAAQQVVYENVNGNPNVGCIVQGILKNYITFYEKPSLTDKNKSRWPRWRRWEKFLGEVNKLRLSEQAPDRTIDTRRSWIDKQTSKTLAMLYAAYGNFDFLLTDVEYGMGQLKNKELIEIEEYRRQKEMEEEHGENVQMESFLNKLRNPLFSDKLNYEMLQKLAVKLYPTDGFLSDQHATMYSRIEDEMYKIENRQKKELLNESIVQETMVL